MGRLEQNLRTFLLTPFAETFYANSKTIRNLNRAAYKKPRQISLMSLRRRYAVAKLVVA